MPNGNFIADPLINYTPSDRMRRIDIEVSAAYGSDPEQVIEILRGVAVAHPMVVESPPDRAAGRFGDGASNRAVRVDRPLRAMDDHPQRAGAGDQQEVRRGGAGRRHDGRWRAAREGRRWG